MKNMIKFKLLRTVKNVMKLAGS